jgi:hypothetical protein
VLDIGGGSRLVMGWGSSPAQPAATAAASSRPAAPAPIVRRTLRILL